MLWFYFKSSIIENAVDVWDRAKDRFLDEIEGSSITGEMWMGSRELIYHLRGGLAEATFEQ